MNGKEIKAARQKANLSIEGLARVLSVSFSTVYLWEHGKSKPGPISRTKLADFFNVMHEHKG